MQIFIDNYPNSEFLDEANSYVQELQTKLEKKDFEISKQYYTIRDYKAAIKSLDNFIGSYPGTPYREDALFITNFFLPMKSQRTVFTTRN